MEIKKEKLLTWGWAELEPLYTELQRDHLDQTNVDGWLKRWSTASDLGDELYNRLYVATSVNTADVGAGKRFEAFMNDTYPKLKSAEQRVKEKLLESELEVRGMELPLRNMRAEVELFREENLQLAAREEKMNTYHDKVIGAQMVDWQGEQKTARQMEAVLREPDRETRRDSWEKLAERQLADREEFNRQWVDYMALRKQIAANAGKSDFREYRWQQRMRFDYTPQDCKSFHKAIEEAVVPAVERVMQRRRKALGIDRLRYYDLFVDLSGKSALKPFSNARELTDKASAIFHHVHPDFGEYFDTMDREGLLDLANRQNKAAGGYCTYFSHARRPFIFANAVGIHEDVQTLLHEGGHSFHAFEAFKLPYFQQYSENNVPTEFAEVASTAMEYLTMPYLEEKYGGYYSKRDAARAKVDHVESYLRFWPYMAMVDAFQHWAYENHSEGANPDRCDEKWAELETRFRPYLDWSGYKEVMKTGWQRKDHIHQAPFYYIEYGLALLGAAQIWANAIQNQSRAVEQYRQVLALGGTATLPQLFQAAGAKLAFDAQTLKKAANLMKSTIAELEKSY
ncbi:MAG TPA: M3 family oligoendopeptidase [Pelolinea sp.]|nr:M3 family oligoendopeptidase [Pelolinea sp.]